MDYWAKPKVSLFRRKSESRADDKTCECSLLYKGLSQHHQRSTEAEPGYFSRPACKRVSSEIQLEELSVLSTKQSYETQRHHFCGRQRGHRCDSDRICHSETRSGVA